MRGQVALLGLIVVAFTAGFYKAARFPAPALFKPAEVVVNKNAGAKFETYFASSLPFVQVHAASLVELHDGKLRAFWFSGSREGAKDVAIHSAIFDPLTSNWGAETVAVTREQTQDSLYRYIAKLGNPVVMRLPDDSLRMFYVTVSLGGWAGSSISTAVSHDDGATWHDARRLITSPFLNISTLVKGVPFVYADGTIGVPIYHEFVSKYAELLRIDPQGVVVDKQRLVAGGAGTLQPVVLLQSDRQAMVLMRYGGAEAPRRVISVTTQDAGGHWSPPVHTTLKNPDAAIAAVRLQDGRLLAVLNDLEHGRDALSLMLSSDDGAHWHEIKKLEDQTTGNVLDDPIHFEHTIKALINETDPGKAQRLDDYVASTKQTECRAERCGFEFSYPYLIQTRSGDFHLVYTWNRTLIKHVYFSQAWLDRRADQWVQDGLH